jgi:hypothetical protein
MWSVPTLYNQTSYHYETVLRLQLDEQEVGVCLPRVEAGSNISTVSLRVVGGDKKGYLESETVKYGREYHGTRTRE